MRRVDELNVAYSRIQFRRCSYKLSRKVVPCLQQLIPHGTRFGALGISSSIDEHLGPGDCGLQVLDLLMKCSHGGPLRRSESDELDAAA
jgi:hypothetical protein